MKTIQKFISSQFADDGIVHYEVEEFFDLLARLKSLVFSKEDDEKIVDIDADAEDPLLNAEIFLNLRAMEMSYRPIADYMETVQTKIDSKSRAECVDSIVESAKKLNFGGTALHLAVNYFDRYLSENDIEIENLASVALTCVMIASKCDEVDFDFDEFTGLRDGAVSADEFVKTEARILRCLRYNVTAPTAFTFLERFVVAARCGREAPPPSLESMAAYIAEISLVSTRVLRFPPSMVAASSVFLAQYVLEPSQKPWNATLRYYTMYEASDLKDCVLVLHDLCGCRSSFPAIERKYGKEKYDCVASKTASSAPVPLNMFED